MRTFDPRLVMNFIVAIRSAKAQRCQFLSTTVSVQNGPPWTAWLWFTAPIALLMNMNEYDRCLVAFYKHFTQALQKIEIPKVVQATGNNPTCQLPSFGAVAVGMIHSLHAELLKRKNKGNAANPWTLSPHHKVPPWLCMCNRLQQIRCIQTRPFLEVPGTFSHSGNDKKFIHPEVICNAWTPLAKLCIASGNCNFCTVSDCNWNWLNNTENTSCNTASQAWKFMFHQNPTIELVQYTSIGEFLL